MAASDTRRGGGATGTGFVLALVSAGTLVLGGCGGGGEGGGTTPPPGGGPTDSQRSAAASATASTNVACTAVQPFYWEIGDRTGRLASGTAGGAAFDATTVVQIASASKWLYGAYVVQKRGGALTADDIGSLNFTSGYTGFSTCLPGQTVQGCVNFLNNGSLDPLTYGRFFYNGGHMQNHAVRAMGLAAMDNGALATEIRGQLGTDIALTYSQPQLAGGVRTSANDYARFLRKLLNGQLLIATQLGSHKVCTNPATCATADQTPSPASENWNYSLGHWVEDDPVVGDHAVSSAGAFGFYPWIDADRHYYGVLSREASAGSGFESVGCGRLIRKAWVTGAAQ